MRKYPERHIFTNSSVTVQLHKESEKIRIKRSKTATGGHHLTQAVHGKTGEHIQKVKLGEQGRGDL